ncbi:cyclic nucleotide-binding protein [Stanieria cyanosphaera PCC 7437]|uniref:Cyclic nucleotide-binding protein n=1 Tax=Stanieria cyanosphaera (strain ATCC 29371 / PCC 7437) TaxID=111780 RepID=K9XRH2_STAC7|nr:cyclic nucleotide-binding domain-containing protein [Stanieria cyanosphaera]AFZ35215.1 cyclic nucleotide-binding protein [Stanieria cyanosphaera PCC 7437]
MFAQLPERPMHSVRWVLTISWLLVIASLFYDPWTVALTKPDHTWSPLRLTGQCIQVQGSCVEEQPYPIGATLFWGAIVPSGIFILLVFGHELWRRICPLAFLSQIPRGLGKQRQFKRENPKTGKIRYELAKVKSDSWLGRNYPYVQFGWLFIGLCGRILFFNADRLVLGLWLVFTIVAAIAVGYYYGGKSWCQYFCPMAPVQTIFSEPRGLLGSKAHMSEQRITQSMCRTVQSDGNEQSACVACQSPCFDIDSERTYWNGLNNPEESIIRYGYVGLVVGYFLYYYLYAGNWDYYFSGVWNRDPNQLASLMSPGLYLSGQPINIPKLFAVPLVLGGFSATGYFLGTWIEQRAKSYDQQHHKHSDTDLIRHRIFVICTFAIFNFFFLFAGRPLLQLTPIWVQYAFDLSIVFLSTLWLQKSWRRSSDLYSRENLANRFRKQLERLQLDVSQYLDGRSLDDLHTNEVYVLAKVLPGFTQEKRHEAYKGVVREALEEGYVSTSSSLAVLQQMRHELGISDDEHQEVLEELGVKDPELLNPNRKRSLENQIRLTGYQKSLERFLRLQQQISSTEFTSSAEASDAIRALRREYSITPQEEEWVLSGFAPDAGNTQKAESLLARLNEWNLCDRDLNHPSLQAHPAILQLLHQGVQHKRELIVRSILEILVSLKDHPSATTIARSLKQLSPHLTTELVSRNSWQSHLQQSIADLLIQPQALEQSAQVVSTQDTLSHLETLLHHYNSVIQAAALFAIAQLDPQRAQTMAQMIQRDSSPSLLNDTAERLLALPPSPALTEFPVLEKLVHLSNSDFFDRLQCETLIALSDRSEIKTYTKGDVITEAGDTCREFLLLIEGDASIQGTNGQTIIRIDRLHPGQILDELEVLTHSTLENTILAESERTRIVAIPVDALDDLLERDSSFARRILDLEGRQLQRLVRLGTHA